MLGSLELKVSRLAIVPLEVSEEVGTSVGARDEVLEDRGLDVYAPPSEAIEMVSEN